MNTEPRNCGRDLKYYSVPIVAAAAGLKALSERRGREAAVGRSAVRASPRGCRSLRRFQREGARGGAVEAPPCVPLGESIAGGSRGAGQREIFWPLLCGSIHGESRSAGCGASRLAVRQGGRAVRGGAGGLLSPAALPGLARLGGAAPGQCWGEAAPGAVSIVLPAAMEPHRWLPLEANPDVSAAGGWLGVAAERKGAACEGGGGGVGCWIWLWGGGGWGWVPALRLHYARNLSPFLLFFSGHQSGKRLLSEVALFPCGSGTSPFIFV